ncbi:hypothetical protein BC939DRAFT_500717 [Gamsiella multidivaricata]|uniref:uncharacterized protein n=1 Tax=Gamsiella multidivaricata TaxID=101098 RepID=UPI00221F9344|nr:uncharacterized protein BC939DRAFT_500717 [Gamsiella multidivaricata]KAI7828605.1 hypothetical protein BC939DRAFT_500717 [Gamsiella multidivaricata]
MSLAKAHATSPDKSFTRTSRKRPCLNPLSEALSNDLGKKAEPIAPETLETIEKLQKKVKLLQRIEEGRTSQQYVLFADQFMIPSKEVIHLLMEKMDSRYQDVGNTRNSVGTEDIGV